MFRSRNEVYTRLPFYAVYQYGMIGMIHPQVIVDRFPDR